MKYKVDNAVIMAAGTSSRFAPLSYEIPKALICVKGEVLIERQISQLRESGIDEVIIVIGYKQEQFGYLVDKYGVTLVENPDYLMRNNNGSIYAARDYLKNTYICSADNYFNINPFKKYAEDSYYSAVYSSEDTSEWCMEEDQDGYIKKVTIGGRDAWYMLGPAFWTEDFSRQFIAILDQVYHLYDTKGMLWEHIFIQHLDSLKMKIKKYPADAIFEFDTLDELRLFDRSYLVDSGSVIMKGISAKLGCGEKELTDFVSIKSKTNEAAGFYFKYQNGLYEYNYKEQTYRRIE